jgi:hypothetical protein
VKDGGEACAVEEEDDVEVEAVVAVGLLAVVGALDTREAFDILVLVEESSDESEDEDDKDDVASGTFAGSSYPHTSLLLQVSCADASFELLVMHRA